VVSVKLIGARMLVLVRMPEGAVSMTVGVDQVGGKQY
jgi:hypothetical protein